jgi:hypothetical protein
VRWQALFCDLESQLDEADAAELWAEAADRSRREIALLALIDRLAPACGHEVVVTVQGAGRVCGRLSQVGSQWLLVDEAPGREVVLPLAGVLSVSGAGRQSSADRSHVFARLRLGTVLRGIVRDRRAVDVVLIDGSALVGTLDRVGADFVELAEHNGDEPRRPANVASVRLVATAAIAALRSRPG